MTIKKGDRFIITYSNKVYKVAGYWLGDIILSPAANDDEECLVYMASEIEELLEAGKLVRKTGCIK